MRRTKNRRFVVGSLLRNIEAPEPVDGKIALRFKSNALKNNFVEEMQDQRSKDALKAAITDAYGSELDLQIRSPHEADDRGGSTANGSPSNTGQPKTAAQESAMVRAAMAMGAKVVAEEDAGGGVDQGIEGDEGAPTG